MPQIHYSTFPLTANQWNKIEMNTPMLDGNPRETEDINKWYKQTGTSFDATQVKVLDIGIWAFTNQVAFYVDELAFLSGYEIDPLINPNLFPGANANTGAYEDATSISNYGVRVYHYNDNKIRSFAQVQIVGQRIRDSLKNPIKTLSLTKKGHTWLRPNQTVTVNDPTLGITSETWRTLHISRSWRRNEPVKITMILVEQYAKVPPTFTLPGEIPASPIIIPSFKAPLPPPFTGPKRG